MNFYALIVAGGSGTRMKSSIPKQFLLLNNRPVLMHTIDRFFNFNPAIQIFLVLPENQFGYWADLCAQYNYSTPHRLVNGGETRFNSVLNGLAMMGTTGIVAIHDGVRPLVSNATLERCFTCAEENGNALPVMPIVDSLRTLNNGQSKATDRSQFVAVQTPQVFRLNEIKKAYQQPYSPLFTDDATVLEGLNIPINLVEGNAENIKITHATDLLLAEAFLKDQSALL